MNHDTSKREIERTVEELSDGSNDDSAGFGTEYIVDTGEGYEFENGDPVPTDDDGQPQLNNHGVTVVLDGDYILSNGEFHQ